MENTRQRPFLFILLFYFLCFIFRAVEYLLIRTDQGIIGEAFIHKLIGCVLLGVTLYLINLRWRDIGFKIEDFVLHTCYGLLLGCIVFVIAYGTEFILQKSGGNDPSLSFYATSYAIQGSAVMQTGVVFVLICILGNILNVIMEEGVFRGLFIRLGEDKHSFWKACLFSALLFGLWHIMQPVRNVLDNEQSVPGAVMMGLMLVITSALLGIQYGMLYKISGSIWIGMAAHFVNNASVNLLHIVTATGSDELLTIRLTIAQTLSFLIVLTIFIMRTRAQKKGKPVKQEEADRPE